MSTNTEYIVQIEKLLNESFNRISPIGIYLTNNFEANENDETFIFTIDILKRIQANIKILLAIKISEDTCVAYRLIMRSITADIIESVYILLVSEEKRKREVRNRNLYRLRTLKTYLSNKVEFFNSRDNKNKIEFSLNMLYNKFPDYVDDSTGDFYRKKGNEEMSTTSMIEYLVKENIISKEYNQLTINYRLLSFTEHYAPIIRRYSYNNPLEIIIYVDIIKWIAVGIELLCNVIRDYYKIHNTQND